MEEILKSENKQFRLLDDGKIFWQSNPTNPLPGEHIAHIEKGDDKLSPNIILDDLPFFKGMDKETVSVFVKEKVMGNIKETLLPLFSLMRDAEEGEIIKDAPKEILENIYHSLGIISREKIEGLIEKIDADDRKILRSRYVRLGPLLVFVPALNKPAAVKLRAMLWNLWNDKDLPAKTPKDGIVSQVVDLENVNKSFYRSIGYPVYGSRAIRIDMLDRVINLIYETADKGVFRADHKMAEWLGCPINDLYEILEAMGHKKISDPVDKKEEKEAENDVKEEVALEDIKKAEEAKGNIEEVKSEEKIEEIKEEKKEITKPQLSLFRLKKGKAYFKKQGDKKSFKGKSENSDKKDKKPFKKKDNFKKNPADRKPQVISTGPKPNVEDSPFAILQGLKK